MGVGMEGLKFTLIGAYLLMAFMYIIWLLCDVSEIWPPEHDGKSAPRIISYVNFAAVAAAVVLIIGLFVAQFIMKILFLIFNFIFIIAMAVMIGLMYSGKMDNSSWWDGYYEASVKAHHENGVMMFTFMFVAVFLEIVVGIMP